MMIVIDDIVCRMDGATATVNQLITNVKHAYDNHTQLRKILARTSPRSMCVYNWSAMIIATKYTHLKAAETQQVTD